jgi:hypothetical protein
LGKFDEDGYKFYGENGKLKIIEGTLIVVRGELLGGLHRLIGDTMVGAALVANAVTEPVMTWHRCLGHISKQGLNVLLDHNFLLGLKFVDLEFCEDFLFGKHLRASFSSTTIKSKNVVDLTHSYTWESPVKSIGGLNYLFLLLTTLEKFGSIC